MTGKHRVQVQMYKRFWEEATGETVKEAGLLFMDGMRWESSIGS